MLVVLRKSKSTTEDRVIEVISFTLNIPSSRIHPHTDLRDDLFLDALDILLLIAKLESRFHVFLTPEEAESIETVSDAARFFIRQPAAA